jgi:hypothetical protein
MNYVMDRLSKKDEELEENVLRLSITGFSKSDTGTRSNEMIVWRYFDMT